LFCFIFLSPKQWLEQWIKPIEQQYLMRLSQRLSEKIAIAFSKIKQPQLNASSSSLQQSQQQQLLNEPIQGLSLNDVRAFGNAILNELHAAKRSERLLNQVAIYTCKLLRQFANQIEALIVPVVSATTTSTNNNSDDVTVIIIIDDKNIAKTSLVEKFNAHLYNSMYKLYSTIQSQVLSHSSIKHYFEPQLQYMDKIGTMILTPVFTSTQTILCKSMMNLIQAQSYLATLLPEQIQAQNSNFVKQFEDKCKTISRVHLSMYDSQTTPYSAQSKLVATELARYYLLLVSLIDGPFSESGLMKLANEMTQFEYIIGAQFYPLDKLQVQQQKLVNTSSTSTMQIHKQMRLFRRLLFLEDLATLNTTNAEVLAETSPVLLLQHIFTSRMKQQQQQGSAGNNMRPEKIMNCSLVEYCDFVTANQQNQKSVLKALLACAKEAEAKSMYGNADLKVIVDKVLSTHLK